MTTDAVVCTLACRANQRGRSRRARRTAQQRMFASATAEGQWCQSDVVRWRRRCGGAAVWSDRIRQAAGFETFFASLRILLVCLSARRRRDTRMGSKEGSKQIERRYELCQSESCLLIRSDDWSHCCTHWSVGEKLLIDRPTTNRISVASCTLSNIQPTNEPDQAHPHARRTSRTTKH